MRGLLGCLFLVLVLGCSGGESEGVPGYSRYPDRRVKVWNGYEVLTARDLNAEVDTLIGQIRVLESRIDSLEATE